MKNDKEYDTSDEGEWQDARNSDWDDDAWHDASDLAEESGSFGWLPTPETTTQSEEECCWAVLASLLGMLKGIIFSLA